MCILWQQKERNGLLVSVDISIGAKKKMKKRKKKRRGKKKEMN